MFGEDIGVGSVGEAGDVDAHVEDGSECGGACRHHGHASVGYGIFVALFSNLGNVGHYFHGEIGHGQRYGGGVERGGLYRVGAGLALLVGVLRHLEGCEHGIVGLRVLVDIVEKFVAGLGHAGSYGLHFGLHVGIFLASDGESCHHFSQRGCERAAQRGY